VANLFESTDFIKFSKITPDAQEHEKNWNRVREIIDRLTPLNSSQSAVGSGQEDSTKEEVAG